MSALLTSVVLGLAAYGLVHAVGSIHDWLTERYTVTGWRIRLRGIVAGVQVRDPEHGAATVLKVDHSPETGRPWALIGPQAENTPAVWVPADGLERAS